MKKILEICVDSLESAMIAEENGASRIELCGDLMVGGVTPSVALFKIIKKHTTIPIRVMIRPRFGDFLFSDYEFEMMLDEVKMFKELGADGIVTGVLKSDGSLDLERMKALKEASGDLDFVLHRAIDVSKEPLRTVKDAIALGCTTVLTSGAKNNCVDGLDLIKEMVEVSNGRIEILVGSGVNADVIPMIYEKTKATSYHMSGSEAIESKMVYRNPNVNMGVNGVNEYLIRQTSAKKVKQAKDALDKVGYDVE